MTTAVPGTSWQKIEGWASDIGVGGFGNNLVVYHIGTNQDIYQWNGHEGWHNIQCRGKALSVGADGDLWFTGLEKGIVRRKNNSGEIAEYGNIRGTDIGVDKNGVPWVCYYIPGFTYRGIWRWDEARNDWEDLNGYASRISGGDGNAWHIGEDNRLYRWNGTKWRRIEGWAEDVCAGHNGDTWHVGRNNQIYFWDGSNWLHVPGEAKRISSGPRGLPWIVLPDGAIYRRI